MKKEIIYHGTSEKSIRKFNLNHLRGGEHTLGIGTYFTRNKEILDFYCSFNEDKGYVYVTEISYKEENIRDYNELFSKKEINSFIKKLNITLTNKEMEEALKTKIVDGHPFFYKLYFDKKGIYLNYKIFVKKFTKATKIKIIKRTEPYGKIIRTDFCVMDPRLLKIIKKVNLNIENI